MVSQKYFERDRGWRVSPPEFVKCQWGSSFSVRLLILLGIASIQSSLFALDARQVFEIVSPSTVLIEDVDSFGSGVFINDKGLILTNYHVVAGNVAIKVRARVKFGNRIVLTELDDVKVTKIHRTYDIALLEVKAPKNGVFIPARLIPLAPPISTGVRCFALGNPGGPDGRALELSITEGIVSAASRKIDDLDYIQVSAQINPGNSGGPISDEFGRVFGIVTSKMTETEGIGFAIPTQKLNMADFIDPKTKAPDADLYRKAQSAAMKLVAMAQMAQGSERQALFLECAEAFRIAMLAAPNSPIPYENLSVVYYQMGNKEMAKKYSEAAFRIEPNDANSCHLLGAMLYDSDKQNKEYLRKCLEFWFLGLTDARDPERMSQCADDVGMAMMDQHQSMAAAYMFRWAEVLVSALNRDLGKNKRTKAWQDLESALPQNQMAVIRAKKEGFTKAEVDSLLAGKPLADVAGLKTPAAVPANPSGNLTPSSSAPVIAIPAISREQMARIATDAAAKFSTVQVPAPNEGLECPLPDVAKNAVLAYAGWQVVISFPDLLKLGIFNLATGKLDGFIECADPQAICAAGGQLLVVYLPGSQMLELYDLATQRKISSRANPLPGPIAFVGMGVLNPARVFVLFNAKNKATNADFLSPAVLNVRDFAYTELVPEIKSGNNPLWAMSNDKTKMVEGALDETGSVAVVIGPASNGMGLGHFVIKDGNQCDFTYGQYSQFASQPRDVAFEANVVVERRGLLDLATHSNPYVKVSRGPNPYFLAPIAGYPGLVAFEDARDFFGFRVFGLPAMNTLVTLPIDHTRLRQFVHMEGKDQIEKMVASVYCDRIAYLLPAEKKMVLFPLGLKSGPAGAGFAQPGKHFERKLTIPAGATVTMQSGPSGMKFDSKNSALVWDVPSDIKTGQMIQVILFIKGADSKESYTVEKISVP